MASIEGKVEQYAFYLCLPPKGTTLSTPLKAQGLKSHGLKLRMLCTRIHSVFALKPKYFGLS